MIHKCKEIIEVEFKPDGHSIVMICGEAIGQSVFQFHCHVIPRYSGDTKNTSPNPSPFKTQNHADH